MEEQIEKGASLEWLKAPTRRDAPQGVPALLESRGRLYFEAVTRGLINPHLMREEDAALRERVKKDALSPTRLYIDREWLDRKNSNVRHIAGNH